MEEEYRIQRANIEKKQQENDEGRERTVSFSRTTENKIEEIAGKENNTKQTEEPENNDNDNDNNEDNNEEEEGKGKEKDENEGNESDDDLDTKLEEISLSSDAPVDKIQVEENEETNTETKKKENNENNKESKVQSRTNSVIIDNNGADEANDDKELNKFSQYSFKNKRLCERWLDNLFMVLYEDLRFYSSFRDEIAHLKAREARHVAYRKSSMEWEVFGDLALRLQHIDEAKEAYLYSFEQKYSSKSLLRLLDIYSNEYNIQGSLEIINRLVILYEFTYNNNTYPNPIGRSIFKLIHYHGLVKVKNAALGLTNYDLIQKYFEYANLFKVEGYNL